MTNLKDVDREAELPKLLFNSDELSRMAIRVRQSELAKILDCSRQAVNLWVRDGKIKLDADGRINPQQAVAQLLRSTDPGLLRSRILAPLMRDLSLLRDRVEHLESELAESKDNVDLYESASSGLQQILDTFTDLLSAEWADIHALPQREGLHTLLAWLGHAEQFGVEDAGDLSDFVPMPTGALGTKKEGAPPTEGNEE